VLVGAAESVTDSVLHAVSDYHIYSRFHFLLLFVVLERLAMLSQGFLCR
jgi:hypothetical protein